MTPHCPICNNQVDASSSDYYPGRPVPIDCKVCGQYRITESAIMHVRSYGIEEGHIISGAIRELNDRGIPVFIESFDRVRDSVVVPRGPLDCIDRILLHVYRNMPTADASVTLAPQFDYSVGYTKTQSEFKFLLDRAVGLDYLEIPYGEAQYRLTLNGWKRISELRESSAKADQAFVAMWFAREMDDIWSDGIKPALEQTGYIPLRVDRAEHNDKIDDRIIAEIRKSGLLIADFTGHRGGVYFEAGFALGLGIPVIWTCRDTDINSTHFDTRQYNHIVWKDSSDLKEKLIARIEATVPLQRH